MIVTNNYMAIAELYAGTLHDDDPLRLLAARQLFLFEKEPHWYAMQARQWGVDAVIGMESPSGYPSEYGRVIEAAGFPYLALPRDADDPEIRAHARHLRGDAPGLKHAPPGSRESHKRG